jgi:hypothetical protein
MLGLIFGGLAVVCWLILFVLFAMKKREPTRLGIGLMYLVILINVATVWLLALAMYLLEGGR